MTVCFFHICYLTLGWFITGTIVRLLFFLLLWVQDPQTSLHKPGGITAVPGSLLDIQTRVSFNPDVSYYDIDGTLSNEHIYMTTEKVPEGVIDETRPENYDAKHSVITRKLSLGTALLKAKELTLDMQYNDIANLSTDFAWPCLRVDTGI